MTVRPQHLRTRLSFWGTVRSLPPNFWCVGLMKGLERLAYYGVRGVAPLYLVVAGDREGLGLSYTDKAVIYGAWALVQGLSIFFCGHFADRWGYRKTLTMAFILNITGYVAMALARPLADGLGGLGWESAGFCVFLLAVSFVGCGSGVFAPPAYGTIAHTTSEQTWSMGWGVFYWLINIGAFFGPLLAGCLRGESNWYYVFYGAAVVSAANLVVVRWLYREPERETPASSARISRVLLEAVRTVLKDRRFIVFLVILSCCPVVLTRFWELLPSYIEQWVDTSDVAPLFTWLGDLGVTQAGQTTPGVFLNTSLVSFILLLPLVAWAMRRLNPLTAVVVGMVVTLVGSVVASVAGIGWICLLIVLAVAVGEIIFSVGAVGYVGQNAPKATKALYMGYFLSLPGVIGFVPGLAISEMVSRTPLDKTALAREYLVEPLGMDETFVMDEEQLPDEQVMPTMAHVLEKGDALAVEERLQLLHGEVDWEELGYSESQEQVRQIFSRVLGDVDATLLRDATELLRQRYKPYMAWYYCGALALVTAVAMFVFRSRTRRA